mmetsp:Transcript_9625/g.11180  ORF Transcript_9625/g.11180 Transcript_9625/m.11180 type:complete len:88 (-) Transcript_9625:128-391(-)
MSIDYLQSYEHMGKVEISCISGCECAATTVDALRPDLKESVPKETNRIKISQDKACTVMLRVLDESSSGSEHKFKIDKLTVSVYMSS